MNDQSAPVIVEGSSLSPIVLTLLRYALTTLGGVMVSKGWLSDSQANELVGGLLIVVPTIVGIVMARRNNIQKRAMAEQLPDTFAQIR